jgi:hypothetical protein
MKKAKSASKKKIEIKWEQPSNSINNNKTANMARKILNTTGRSEKELMDSLSNINNILDKEFEYKYNLDNYVSHNTREGAIEDFVFCFEMEYNGEETDDVDLEDIKQLCDFDKVMSICAYVAEKYDEYYTRIATSHFKDKDKILIAYIYLYLCDKKKPDFIKQLEAYDFKDDEKIEEVTKITKLLLQLNEEQREELRLQVDEDPILSKVLIINNRQIKDK